MMINDKESNDPVLITIIEKYKKWWLCKETEDIKIEEILRHSITNCNMHAINHPHTLTHSSILLALVLLQDLIALWFTVM